MGDSVFALAVILLFVIAFATALRSPSRLVWTAWKPTETKRRAAMHRRILNKLTRGPMAGILWGILASSILIAAIVSTARFNNYRTGSVTTETQLTRSNVAAGKFGKLGSYAVDGQMYGQPLYLPNITVSGSSKDLIVVATMNDTVYAFDANAPGSAALWTRSMGTARSSYPTVGGEQLYYGSTVGCVSTPVADLTANVLYVVCTNSTPTWVLAKINLSTGVISASTTITGQVVGTGDPTGGDTTSGANLLFYPGYEFNRSALTLANGSVYVAFAAYDDAHPWHGWLFAYDSSLAQTAIWCASPNGYGAGVWYSGGPAVDDSGNLFVMTGNGDYDGTANFSESFVKLSSSLAVLDWFTPTNWATLTAQDKDLSTGPILIPSASLAVGGGKDANVYSVNTGCMGRLGGTVGGCTAPQVFASSASILFTMFMNSVAYFSNNNSTFKGYTLTGSTFNTTPTAAPTSTASPGQMMSGSANGTNDGIVWAVTVASSAFTSAQAGTLRALRSDTLVELWSSAGIASDALGSMSKYAAPTPANGRVYVATQDSTVVVYGLIPSSQSRGTTSRRGTAVVR